MALVEGSCLLPCFGIWHYSAGLDRPLVRLGILIKHQTSLPAYRHYVLPLQHCLQAHAQHTDHCTMSPSVLWPSAETRLQGYQNVQAVAIIHTPVALHG